MREFGIEFSKGLKRGLRAFLNAPREERELVECYNLEPSELMLIPHEVVSGIDVSALINLTPTELTGIRAYWKLDEAAGGPYLDSVASSDMLGLTAVSTATLTSVTGIESNAARSINLSLQANKGSEGAYAADNSQLTLAASYTINLWIRYVTNNSLSYWILRKTEYDVTTTWDNPVLKEWGIWNQGASDGARSIIFYRGDGAATWSQAVQCNMTARANVWHMINISYNHLTTTLTVRVSNVTDGFEAFTAFSNAVPVLVNTSQPIVLANFQGLSEGTVNFDYDELGIWARELTLTERTRLWNSGGGRTYPFI